MSTVLALEPDDRRTDFLRAVVCEKVRARLVVADTLETALAAISTLMPDVVLVGPDSPPGEEIEIRDYLRSLQRSIPLEIVRMPAPSQCAPRARTRPGLLGALRRRAAGTREESAEKDDLAALAGHITGALDRVKNARASASTSCSTLQPAPGWRATPGPDPRTRSNEGVGNLATIPATPGIAADALPDVADGDQDEWGLFDPSRCGYPALAATLDTSPEEVQQIAELSPADMLLQCDVGVDPAARLQPPVLPSSAAAGQEAPTAARRERRRDQPAPLSLWVHLFGWEGERPAPGILLSYTEAIARVAALLVGLDIPARIADVAYGSGCRVRSVRGLTGAGFTTPTTFEVASSWPDSSSICQPGVLEPTTGA